MEPLYLPLALRLAAMFAFALSALLLVFGPVARRRLLEAHEEGRLALSSAFAQLRRMDAGLRLCACLDAGLAGWALLDNQVWTRSSVPLLAAVLCLLLGGAAVRLLDAADRW